MTAYTFHPNSETSILISLPASFVDTPQGTKQEHPNAQNTACLCSLKEHLQGLFLNSSDKTTPPNPFSDFLIAYSSLLLFYTPSLISSEQIRAEVDHFFKCFQESSSTPSFSSVSKSPSFEHHDIPVCYDLSYGLDLEAISKQTNFSIPEVIEQHHSPLYRICALGFIPGFPYLFPQSHLLSKPSILSLPRKNTPRLMVPQGSVAIAAGQSGIYPLDSPGGWWIVGRTPKKLYTPELYTPETPKVCPFEIGDTLRFIPISKEEFLSEEKKRI